MMDRQREDCRQTDKIARTVQRNSRLTIGYLAFLISDDLGRIWWSGVADTTWKQGANLICFRGGPLHDPMDPSTEPTAVYELVSCERVDGWVIGNIVADTPASLARLKNLLDQQQGVAAVSLRELLDEIPYVSMSNYHGVQAAVAHLVETHGYRRIAFLRGPAAHPYAQERYRAYTDTLQKYGLPLDLNLVTPPRDWSEFPMQILLDERQLKPPVDFDAVVAANDWMALDAMNKLIARGARIPRDVAVVGFNNNPAGRVAIPPLTTIAMPFYGQGQRAVEMLLALLAGDSLQEQAALPAHLVIRQSCGCQSPLVTQAAAGVIAEEREFRELDLAQREHILASVAQAAGSESVIEWAGQLLDGLITELRGETPGIFIREMDQAMQPIMMSGGDLSVWQKALSALRRLTLPYTSGKLLGRVEDLWQQAQVMFSLAVQRVQTAETLQAQKQAQIVRGIGHALGSTFDIKQLMDTVARELPRLGIPSCYIALYEDPQAPAAWSRLIMAYNEKGQIELEPDGVRFKSSELLPEELWPRDKQFSLVVEPLYFQKNQLGFMVFEVGPQSGAIYEMLSTQISSALQGALLVQRVQKHSAELARQKYILDTFMESVPDRIYFKDLNGGITRANKAHAARLGLSQPGEEIGKTDADFFPPEEAQVKYQQEQRIIQTGEPLLNLEEKHTWLGGWVDWSLTTKMPLRDERGNIIGIFGISRDITELKLAQAALERAYAEVEQLVEKRTAELRQSQAQLIQSEKMAALGRLTASIAHEINNPLQAVQNSLELALEELEGSVRLDRLGRYLRMAEVEIGRLAAIMRRMRDFYRPVHEGIYPTDVNAVLRGVLELMSKQLEHSNIAVECNCADDLPTIQANADYLKQVFLNLVLNAIDEMSARGGTLRVRTSLCQMQIPDNQTKPSACIEFSDTGRGIPPEILSHIFEPFVTTKQTGTGLGLFISYGLIEAHDGQVTVTSQVGVGTTFTVLLPVA